MSHTLALCWRSAVDERRFPRAGWAVVVAAVAFGLAACSPYPIYTHSGNDQQLASRGDQTEDETGDVERGGTYRDQDGAFESNVPPSTVDPRVFARVVDMYLGTPYREGGRDADGIDCSNLASALYEDYCGKRLPASTRALYRLPTAIPEGDLQVGDLIFFSFSGERPAHVGVYMGDGRFVHASETQGVVFSSLKTPYYRDAFRGARRVM